MSYIQAPEIRHKHTGIELGAADVGSAVQGKILVAKELHRTGSISSTINLVKFPTYCPAAILLGILTL